MILYGASFSPFVRKVMVFAAEKGLKLELRHPRDATYAEEFAAISPFGKMPGFRDGEFTLSDSTAIITYLDTLNPEPNLMPAEAQARARTVWFEEYGDTIIAACGSKIFFNRVVSPRFMGREGDLAAADEAQRTEFPRLIDYLESVVPTSGYLVEDRFTLADIAVASPLATMGHAACGVDGERWPKAAKYLDGILSRPSFAGILALEKRILSAA